MRQAHWLLARAAASPQDPALEDAAGTVTFAGLAGQARRGAGWLAAVLPGGDAPVALLLPGGAGFAAWFHAVSLAGRAVLPLNLRLTGEELARQLADARSTLLLGAAGDARLAALAQRLPGLDARVAPDLETLPAAPGALPGERIDPAATLAVLFTSGTTGRSKGACLSFGNFQASAAASRERLGPAVGGRWLACMPLFHVGGMSILMRSALFGGPVRLLDRFDAAAVSDALDPGDVAGLSLVPTMLGRLVAHRGARPAPPGLRVLLLGGAATAPSLLQRALAAGYPVCLTYGLTEATSQVATAPPPASATAGPQPMTALPGTEIRIVGAGGVLPAGEAGEITVRGPTVMAGYLNDPEATARSLRDGWLYTGDLGRLDARGGLHVLDRRDDLVISGGENVYPAEVEAVLLEHPAVSEAGVSGVPDPDLGARVVAWVVAAPGAAPDAAVLAAFCRGQLAGFKVPREFRVVASLPRTSAGKLQRRRLAGWKGTAQDRDGS